MPRMGPKLLSIAVPLAVAGVLVAVAWTQEAEGPVQSVAYYWSHPAEWERRVWVCTNEPGTLEHTPECANALLALRRATSLSVARTPVAARSHLSDAK